MFMFTQKRILIAGAILAGVAVGLGAFGAHALKPLLQENGRVDTFELATRYHFYHAFQLLVLGAMYPTFSSRFWRASAWMSVVGIGLFSGSLYVMAIFNTTRVALITPLGGVCFLAAWTLMAIAIYRNQSKG